ncbi:BREX-1 system phosphatase PglZ type A [Aneurinibacillus sp. Ricciae_BoGa-3]|uniref:BREX-1 system phosphatase PglZ type A n=1 Tax=Aneurinibacillus sp. Ricciae_BoGa-3 TaxID=3022697 RepID=UPI002341D915|nr:BREX-1 system phosphatase PglZ type A [Aneurinibacillus sp. Ricciae_BoGa-3]WCK54752.1 BREX-1 system phosphatase PglZ type A [Aneurinibacillus sp. Ricciae_BoGa-3]
MDILNGLLDKVKSELVTKKRAIVFWYDSNPKREIEEIKAGLEEEHIKLWELNEINFFRTKYELEIVSPDQSYVVYASFPKPADKDNLLLDMVLYSAEFQADDIAMLIERYGVEDYIMRPIIEANRVFFNDQRRAAKLSRLLPEQPNAKEFELGMMAVLVGAQSIHLPDIVQHVLVKGLDEETNEAYKRMQKFFTVARFWELSLPYFGLRDMEQTQSLRPLFYALLFSHFATEAMLALPSLEEKYRSTLPNTCRLFIDDWLRATPDHVEILEGYICDAQREWNVQQIIGQASYEQYERCDTFWAIDVQLIERAAYELVHDMADIRIWSERIAYRKKKYWGEQVPFSRLYRVLEEAFLLWTLKEQGKRTKITQNGFEWFTNYVNVSYKIDQTYRRLLTAFIENDTPHERIHSLEIHAIEEMIERLTNWYENVYLQAMASDTDQIVIQQLASQWSIPEIVQQRSFYRQYVRPILQNEPTTRVFVIVSDALRYEAGVELAERLNKRVNGQALVTGMQASIPSYTQLGMASLLPNNEIGLSENGDVLVDGKNSRGLGNRQKILQAYEPQSVAYSLMDLVNTSVSEGEELLKGKRVCYLYHDCIDATGDNQKSERRTYQAVSDTLDELDYAVQKVVARYQAKRIFITSDHGFLFQLRKVEADAKTEAVRGNIVDGNRRFAIGKDLQIPENAARVSLDYIGLYEYEAVIANGLQRFTGGGGLRFIHGGALPQEIIIPVIEYREIFGKGRKKDQQRVDVRIAMRDRIITNYRMKVTLFQEQKAEGEFAPRNLRVAFYQNGERISNEVSLMFDHTGEAAERHQEVIFTLIERPYHMGEDCELRMEDVSAPQTVMYREDVFTIRMYDVLY